MTKLPFMLKEDIDIIEAELKQGYGRLDILEWGSGWSTKYFSDVLNEKNIDFMWESIEYDVKWYIEMLKLNMQNVRLHLFDEEILRHDDRRAIRTKPMNEYVLFPKKLGKKYDIIFVDGRKRRRCLLECIDLLKPKGIIFLHDADRPYYNCVLGKFEGKKLTNKLWKGKLK